MENVLIELIDLAVKPQVYDEAANQPFMVKDIHLCMKEGEWITLIGRNGSGKSTLAKVIAGFNVGQVSGQIIRRSEAKGRAIEAPIVMQQPDASMVGATPWEDIVLMLEQHEVEGRLIPSCAEQALNRTGMLARAHQAVGTLSGGQKQLTAIAGCLAIDSQMLVLDEPTAMLDPEAAIAVLDMVRELHRTGITVIWITQKLEELLPSDRVVAMDKGTIVFDAAAERFYERSKPPEQVNGCMNEKEKFSESDRMLSICERLGLEAPYVVQTAWELERLGMRFDPLPMTPDMLVKAVQSI